MTETMWIRNDCRRDKAKKKWSRIDGKGEINHLSLDLGYGVGSIVILHRVKHSYQLRLPKMKQRVK